MNTPIDFYFDFSSPYSYIASEWIEALAARHGRTVRWHAILLGATFQAAELKPPVAHPLKREYSLRDFRRSARFEGVPYTQPDEFPIPTQAAARTFWWLNDRHGADAALTADVRRICRQMSKPLDFGIGADAAESVWNDAAWKLRLKQENEAAIAAGVFGAPFFIVDGEPFWGNDRKAQIERWLAKGPF